MLGGEQRKVLLLLLLLLPRGRWLSFCRVWCGGLKEVALIETDETRLLLSCFC